ncbi:two-component system regulatory protein YycI [Halobacillus salinus]|uniref:Regulatory protein YycH-like domain-containing protein n=1 Tax=Halobacillus salinus TaxID=192814 RepID=A0A4Z0GXA8_9BACI|nr:two-component system regulatory protein YycI [Halobacillus salinus]TGB01228.1 hypothetical protein E4663_17275 [Halobacillus salinus]
MQWGQIKTLFILSFLILDLFLLQVFLEKQSDSGVRQLTIESEQIIDRLENRGIELSDDILNEEAPTVSRISSEDVAFSDRVRSQIKQLEEDGSQQIDLLETEGVLMASLEEPAELTDGSSDAIISEVAQVVPFADQYSYWGYNEEEGVALFFQKVNNRTVYFNQGGLLMVRIEEGAITDYVATLLSLPEEEEAASESSRLTSKVTIINQLSENGYIQSGDEITSMQVGYYNALNPSENIGPQLFEPTWKIVVNDEESYFAFAISGEIIEVSEDDFIEDMKQAFDFRDYTFEEENTQDE